MSFDLGVLVQREREMPKLLIFPRVKKQNFLRKVFTYLPSLFAIIT
jgi:hypothetical protein